jgi:processive 1,2-diacylglycerol beta-glucosyltransferase
MGSGHGAAAQAIEEAFVKKYPAFEVKTVNILDFAFDIFKKVLPKAYFLVSSKASFIYKWVYKYHKRQSRHDFLNRISNGILKGSFIDFIKKFNPDFIISTNPLPMHLVSKSKEEKIINTPSANVCTDFGFHSFWYNRDVNYYFVATSEIKKKLARKKVKAKNIIITGIPVKEKFKDSQNKEQIARGLRLDGKKPILLIIGGKMSYDNLMEVLRQIREKNNDAQFLIVAGRDNGLLEKLKVSEIKKDKKTRIFGFIDNLEQLMSVSDLIITKAGGVTVAECLAKNLPMVINDAIPGQEEDNVRYVKDNEVGFEARSIKQCSGIVARLFSDHKKIDKLKENCKKISKPDAAQDMADFIASKLS